MNIDLQIFSVDTYAALALGNFVIKAEAVKKSNVCPRGVVQCGVFLFAKNLLNVVVVAVAVNAVVFDFVFEMVAFDKWML